MVLMADAKRQHDWNIASSVMALTAEINRDRKRRRKPFKPDDFNPYTVKRPVPVRATVEQVAQLLSVTYRSFKTLGDCHPVENLQDGQPKETLP